MNNSLHTEIKKNHLQFQYCISLISTLFFFLFSIFLLINLNLKPYIPNYFLVIGLCLTIPLFFHNHWPKPINFILPYYWLIALCYFFPFQFSILLLFNQNVLFLHLAILIALVIMILLVNLLFIFPLIMIGILASYSTFCLTTGITALEDSIIITTLTACIIGFLMSAIEFYKQKHQERKLDQLKLLSGAIAHELRTPLASIVLGLNSLQSKYLIKDISPTTLNTLAQMESASKNASTTIEIILNNIRDQKEIEKTLMSLSDCIKLAVEEYPLSPTEKKLIHLKIDSNYFINGDPDSLKRVIWNLLKNALYQIKKHNKGEIYINLKSSSSKTTLIFQDTAQGITDAEAPHLFEKFYSTTKNGSGLGLAFCKKIIESHNGQIYFDYSPGSYIKFIISFPTLI